tara:strand:- start:2323 stop:2514 length:192 start_codon:yes stop_codon:yes gene_type:complete
MKDKILIVKMKNNEWVWDTIDIGLTNPKGETVMLKSGDLRDTDMSSLFEIIQHYVDKQGGELA